MGNVGSGNLLKAQKNQAFSKGGKGAQKKQILRKGAQKKVQKDESGGQLGEFIGTIDKLGPMYGFIDCDELKAEGHDKVFILWDEFKQYKAGQTVRFTGYLDKNG